MKTSTKNFSLPFSANTVLISTINREHGTCIEFLDQAEVDFTPCESGSRPFKSVIAQYLGSLIVFNAKREAAS